MSLADIQIKIFDNYITFFNPGKLHPANRLNEGANEGINEGVNEGVNRLLKLIEENPGNRKPYFVSSMNVPEKTMERWLKYLRESQKIEFRGAAKTGGYYSKQ
ncbi:hypothetical protein [Leadbetterella sp. DM7]|uniref:hypothetical protein n=1 Tax=Leadbetterella sp. DM7 TaxID=3235085 RepID=UPI00349ECC7D